MNLQQLVLKQVFIKVYLLLKVLFLVKQRYDFILSDSFMSFDVS